MLVIRLARTGRKNQPKFRVAVAENSKPVDGKVVEVVGHFNPTMKKDPLVINKEAIESWISKGAQPSNTVSRLLNVHAGFNLDVKQNLPRKPRKEVEAKPEASAPPDGSASAGEPASTEDDSGKDSDKDSDNKPVEGEAPVVEEAKEEVSTEEVKVEPAPSDDGLGKEVKEEVAEKPAEEPKQEESAPSSEDSDKAPKEEEKAEPSTSDDAGEAGK